MSISLALPARFPYTAPAIPQVFPMFALVDIGGFQEKVEKGMKLKVPLQEAESGKVLTFDKVFLISDGDKITIGSPLVSGASIEAKVLKHGRGEKIRIQKFKRRKRYRRVKGHRQHFTEIEITKVTA
jgi:large subunit ribosomal protein L21